MAKAKQIPELEPQTRFGDAAAAAIEVRAAEVFLHADGVLDTSDITGVHDMRVATRRLRAAMEVFAVCFPSKEHAKLLAEVKRLADVLGERRDPDVAIEELEGISAELGGTRGLRPLIKELRAEQELANERLVVALQRIVDQGLAKRLSELAEAARR